MPFDVFFKAVKKENHLIGVISCLCAASMFLFLLAVMSKTSSETETWPDNVPGYN